jgi:Site-specific recombinase XerD
VFAAEQKHRPPSSLKISDLDADMVLAFLNHLEQDRKSSVSTRNVRRTALRSFFRHVGYEDPASLGIVERVLLVPAKRCDRKGVDFLRPEEQTALLDAPDRSSVLGRRDHAFLLFLVRTGARESEAIAVDIRHARLVLPRQVLLFARGARSASSRCAKPPPLPSSGCWSTVAAASRRILFSSVAAGTASPDTVPSTSSAATQRPPRRRCPRSVSDPSRPTCCAIPSP